jgi:hypothetical protein
VIGLPARVEGAGLMADMMRVVIFNETVYNIVETHSIQALIDWLGRWRDKVPAEFRDSARCEIQSICGSNGENHAELTIVYFRSETPEEVAWRVQRHSVRVAEELTIAKMRLAKAEADFASCQR